MGWLRAILAQRRVNQYRKIGRETELGEIELAAAVSEEPDLERVEDLRVAIKMTLSEASAEERFLLSAYYLDPVSYTHLDVYKRQFQRIANLRVDTPYRYEIVTGTEDNHILHIRVSDPKEPAIAVTMRFDAVRKERIQPLVAALSANGVAEPAGPPDLTRYLQPDRLVPLDDTIRRWAREVVDAAGAKTDLEMARAIYNLSLIHI